MKLYEITEQLRELTALADEQDINPIAIHDTLELVKMDFRDKAINVAAFFQNIEAEVEAMKAAEKRIAVRRKAKENLVASLREYLKMNMEMAEIKKIEHPEFSISLRKSAGSVVIDDESLIPDEFWRIKREVDKTAIKSAGDVPGTHIEQGFSLVIR